MPLPPEMDPLVIYYFFVTDDEEPEDTSVFQGFGHSLFSLSWAMRLVAPMPADVLEQAHPIDGVIAQRIGGLRPNRWAPLTISAVESQGPLDLGLFVVLLSGQQDVAERVAAWIARTGGDVLHVSSVGIDGVLKPDEFDEGSLLTHCLSRLRSAEDVLDAERFRTAAWAFEQRFERRPVEVDLPPMGHNALVGNRMALERAGRRLGPDMSFVGRTESDYTAVIIESCEAVMSARSEVGPRDFHALSTFPASLVLSEPALFRHAYRTMRNPRTEEARATDRMMKFFKQQRGLINNSTEDLPDFLNGSKLAQYMLVTRQMELETHALTVGMRASQTCSAVMRLTPAVNHVFNDLAGFARSVRADKPESRLKARRLFERIQSGLIEGIGPERLAYITDSGPRLKIVADAPLEWLPIDGLPLSFRKDVSRINATPGNLMVGQLVVPRTVTFTPHDLQKVLVVSSFSETDRLRGLMRASIEAIRHQWQGKVEVIFKTASSRSELVDVLNAYDGMIMVFDGHGAGNQADNVGTLVVGADKVDAWSLRSEARVPPIVVLSACDTQGIDSSSHATVGNGFLAAGARTVLATMLPVDGMGSASFVTRLIYRLADFLPAALSMKKRVLDWTEVISGMLRMLLATEILDALVGPPSGLRTPRGLMQRDANMDINGDRPDWYERLIQRIAEHRGESAQAVTNRAKGIIARSEAIRYVQLGNPESIAIDDGSVFARFAPGESSQTGAPD